MRKNGKKKELPQDISLNGKGFGLSLGALLGKGADNESEKNSVKNREPKTDNPVRGGKLGRYSLQKQTAGRGGKVVTLVIFPNESGTDLEALAKEMRNALGCGAHVETNSVVLQGDIAGRAKEWLERKNSGGK